MLLAPRPAERLSPYISGREHGRAPATERPRSLYKLSDRRAASTSGGLPLGHRWAASMPPWIGSTDTARCPGLAGHCALACSA
jgi:hypothetical protein